MNKNRKLLLTSLLCLPFLMGNSPAPFAHPEEYEDFSLSISSVTRSDDTYNYYNLTVENTGTGYIDPNDLYIKNASVNRNGTYGAYSSADMELIAPGKTSVIEIYSKSYLTPSIEECSVVAYSDYDTGIYEFSDIKAFTKEFNGYEDENKILHYEYKYSTTFTLIDNDLEDQYESCIYCVNYNGEDHYYYSYDIYHSFSFRSFENLDVESITLNSSKSLFLKRNSYYRNSYFDFSVILKAFAVIIFVIPVIGGLVTALVFLIIGIVKKNKRKKN